MNHTFKESIKSYVLCCKLLIFLIFITSEEDNPNTHGLYEFDLAVAVVVFCLYIFLLIVIFI